MTIDALLILLLVGALAGWLAGVIVSGYGYGLLGNIVVGIVGIVGAVLAGFLFPALGLSLGGGLLASILHATLGAVVLLALIKLIGKV